MKQILLSIILLTLLPLAQTPGGDSSKGTVSGVVTNGATNEPVARAHLILRMIASGITPGIATRAQFRAPQAAAPSATYTAVSDAAGKFEFAKVDPGSYVLAADKAGFESASIGSPQAGKLTEPITVSAGSRKSDLAIRMTPYGAITGHVTDGDGDPLEGMFVEAMVYRYSNQGRQLVAVRQAGTDDTGAYRLYNLPAGKYYLRAGPQRNQVRFNGEIDSVFGSTYFPGVLDGAAATPLELAAGQQMSGYNFSLLAAHSATIRGSVIAPADAVNLQIGTVVITGNSTSTTTSSVRGPNGKFELTGISPGNVYLTGSYVLDGKRFSSTMPLEVATADIDGVELRPMAPMDITGVVRVDGGGREPLPKLSQLQFRLESAGGVISPSNIHDDGSFTMRGLSANKYTVAPVPLPDTGPSVYLKQVQWDDQDITDGSLDLTNGLPPRAELTLVFGGDVSEISGTVNAGDSPADSGIVVVVPTGGRKSRLFYKVAQIRAEGRFTISGVAPGSYKVFAWDKADINQVIYDPDFVRSFESQGKSVELRSNDKQSLEVKLIVNKQP